MPVARDIFKKAGSAKGPAFLWFERLCGAIVKIAPQRSGVKRNYAKFRHTVDTELVCLHEGNIARFRLLPSQYHGWKEAQDAGEM